MTEINKLLWLLFICALSTGINLASKHIKSKKFDIVVGAICVIILLIVSFSWSYLDFWK